MQHTDMPLAILGALRRMGVRIVLDDFGTGYMLLSGLKDFPLDVLKIDRSFIDRLGDDPDSEPIVVAIISMARASEASGGGRGRETERALARLSALGLPGRPGSSRRRRPIPAPQADVLRRELASARQRQRRSAAPRPARLSPPRD